LFFAYHDIPSEIGVMPQVTRKASVRAASDVVPEAIFFVPVDRDDKLIFELDLRGSIPSAIVTTASAGPRARLALQNESQPSC